MHMKATAIAPSNLPFIKYMGRKDEVLRLPENGSISMNLSGLLTTTTVEFSPDYRQDSVMIDGTSEEGEESRAIRHLDRIRGLANIDLKAKVMSTNTFPRGTGLSSSSSGFAALTVAGAGAAGLHLSERELSILARQGSGSACRSIPDGIVEWFDGETSEESYAATLYPPGYWDIADVVAIMNTGRKEVGSSVAHQQVASGPYYRARIDRMPGKIKELKSILQKKDFVRFGELVEEEARDLHVIFISAGLWYITPESLRLLKEVPRWRADVAVYYSLNTGQDVHLLCQGDDVGRVQERLSRLDYVRSVIVNKPAKGARLIEEHLF